MMDSQSCDLAALNMKSDHPWEASNRPWVLFNADRTSMCFLGFKIDPNGHLLNDGGQPGERVMSSSTYAFLREQDASLIVDDINGG